MKSFGSACVEWVRSLNEKQNLRVWVWNGIRLPQTPLGEHTGWKPLSENHSNVGQASQYGLLVPFWVSFVVQVAGLDKHYVVLMLRM